MQQLDRLEEAGVPSLQTDPEHAQRVLRLLGFLSLQARDMGASTAAKERIQERIQELEFRVRTGVSKEPDASHRLPGSLDKTAVVGTVTRASDGQPIEGVGILIWTAMGSFFDFGGTDADGQYRIGLIPGQFFVYARRAPYVSELYEDVLCSSYDPVSCSFSDGTLVTVGDGADTTVSFSLVVGGTISGHLTATATGLPVTSSYVQLWPTDGDRLDSQLVGEQGEYEFDGLDSGSYYASTDTSAISATRSTSPYPVRVTFSAAIRHREHPSR